MLTLNLLVSEGLTTRSFVEGHGITHSFVSCIQGGKFYWPKVRCGLLSGWMHKATGARLSGSECAAARWG
jgi:hypothetical protein